RDVDRGAVRDAVRTGRRIGRAEGDLHQGDQLVDRDLAAAVAVPNTCARCWRWGGRLRKKLDMKHACAGAGVERARIDGQHGDGDVAHAEVDPATTPVGALEDAALIKVGRGVEGARRPRIDGQRGDGGGAQVEAGGDPAATAVGALEDAVLNGRG